MKYNGQNASADNVAFFNVSAEEANTLPIGILALNRFGVEIGRGNVACMITIADKLTDVGQRIAETERRIAELKLVPQSRDCY